MRLRIVAFVRVCVRSLRRRTQWSSGSFWFAWVHCGAPRGGLVHSGLPGFIQAHRRGGWIHLCLHGFTRSLLVVVGYIAFARVYSDLPCRCIQVGVGSLGSAKCSSCSFGLSWVTSGEPRGCLVNSGSFGIILANIEFAGLIGNLFGSLRRAKASRGSLRFAWVPLRHA